jgi:hypothetical protein
MDVDGFLTRMSSFDLPNSSVGMACGGTVLASVVAVAWKVITFLRVALIG